MKCPYCGANIPDNARFCGSCGANIAQTAYSVPYSAPQDPRNSAPVRMVSFGEAIGLFFSRYATFTGRSTRAEYWWIVLFNMLVSTGLGYISGTLTGIYDLIVFVPMLALACRRLHDIGKSGWNYLWNLLPIVGQIMTLVWFCRESGPDNQYGVRETEPRTF